MDYIQKINDLQKKVENLKLEQVKLEERTKTLKEEETKILNELKQFEVSENDLEGEIAKINEEIEKELNKCEEILK